MGLSELPEFERRCACLGDDIDRFGTRESTGEPPRVVRNVGVLPFTREARGKLIGVGFHNRLDDTMNAEVVIAEVFSQRLQQFGIRWLKCPRRRWRILRI